jgi:tRNA pseudouridine(38-40) synthase
VSQVEEATKYFIGTHDFRTFMGRPNLQQENKKTVRTIIDLKLIPAQSLMPKEFDPIVEHYDFYQVICKGRSFLYRQVREYPISLIIIGNERQQKDCPMLINI